MNTTLPIQSIAAAAFFFTAFSAQAQSTLAVNCFTDLSIYNAIYLDSQVVEYGASVQPAFYVAVFDQQTCTPWGTEYQGTNPGHDFGNANNDGENRMRVENYFMFHQDDSAQLAGMNTMLGQIPAGNAFVIYTPMTYSYLQVNALCPALTQTLFANWDPAIIGSEHIMVLFGIQGQANSFTEDTLVQGDHIAFSTTINCNTAAGLNELSAQQTTVSYKGNYQLEIIGNGTPEALMVTDMNGRQIPFVLTEKTIQLTQEVPFGIYFVTGITNHEPWTGKVAVSW